MNCSCIYRILNIFTLVCFLTGKSKPKYISLRTSHLTGMDAINLNMKMKLFGFLCALILATHGILAQDISINFGVFDENDQNFTSYSLDEDADAVVMFDKGHSYYIINDNDQFELRFRRECRIKILTEAGLKWSKLEIPIYNDGSFFKKAINVVGRTYNVEDGKVKITPVDPETIVNQRLSKITGVKKVAFPNVKPGSFIEFSYDIAINNPTAMPDWTFQSTIPTIYSSYRVDLIPFFDFVYLLQGTNHFSSTNSSQGRYLKTFGAFEYYDKCHEFVMTTIPAFKSEDFITSKEHYLISMDFQIAQYEYPNRGKIQFLSNWEEIIKEYDSDEDFGGYISKSGNQFKHLINEDDFKGISVEEKFNKVVTAVKRNFKFNNIYSEMATQSSRDFVASKKGSSGDINLFLVGALQEVGLEAYPVLISTRSHGFVSKKYPFTNYFNNVIVAVKVNGELILTDGVDPFCANNQISIDCINDDGLVVNKGEVKWISTDVHAESESKYFVNIRIDSVKTESIVTLLAKDYEALNFTNRIGNYQNTVLKRFSTSEVDIDPTTIKVKLPTESDYTYKLDYSAHCSFAHVQQKLYVKPFLNLGLNENLLIEKERSYPVDMIYPKRVLFNANITIPDGYEIESKPRDYDQENSLVRISYHVLEKDNQLTVQFQYAFKKGTYNPQVYHLLRECYETIVNKSQEMIVLKEK